MSNENWNTNQIRSEFLGYFEKHDHKILESAPLVPKNDPTLMFVNAGMVQFKNWFAGTENPSNKRVTTSQKCVRAGGKHNDLENVGYTARHHTFFEMLGNFSFGDYFKEEAIFYSWDLLTNVFGIDKSKLYITVYHDDDEAISYWKKIAGLEDSRIIRINTDDNFWSMGPVGPCGPCSEVFYDHGDHIAGGLPGTKDQDGDRFVEIWNLVFMQYNQIDENKRILLPKPCIDTGMGLERVAAILQGVRDNYDTDILKNLMERLSSYTKIKITDTNKPYYKIIIDHLRSSVFLIADGVTPSNTGRGYVLRRIMRRALMSYERHLQGNAQNSSKEYSLFTKLIDHIIQQYRAQFPELTRARDFICEVIEQETLTVSEIINKASSVITDESNRLKGKNDPALAGEIAFKLYDTHGVPLDITEDLFKSFNITVDRKYFDQAMTKQRTQSKASWTGSGEQKIDDIFLELYKAFGSTKFEGYNKTTTTSKILALISNNERVSSIELPKNSEQKFYLICDQTVFYGESGGQVGDIGLIETKDAIVRVFNSLKYNDMIIHECGIYTSDIKSMPIKELEQSQENKISSTTQFNIDDIIELHVDKSNRDLLSIHHTATHILHAAVRQILGKHIVQKGSLVTAEKLRFDFGYHPVAIEKDQLKAIEDLANSVIFDDLMTQTNEMPAEKAMESGAMALFGEKYQDDVRVVSIGGNIASDTQSDNVSSDNKQGNIAHHNISNDSKNSAPNAYSVELCGGTHVNRTSAIGFFKIISEGSIAAGIRRIEAVCGKFALKYVNDHQDLLEKLLKLQSTDKDSILDKTSALLEDKKSLENQLFQLRVNSLVLSDDVIQKYTHKIQSDATDQSPQFLLRNLRDIDMKTLRNASEILIKKHTNLIVIHASITSDKLSVVIGVPANLATRYQANIIAQKIAPLITGKGGGNKAIAQIGSNEINKISEISFENIQKILDLSA